MGEGWGKQEYWVHYSPLEDPFIKKNTPYVCDPYENLSNVFSFNLGYKIYVKFPSQHRKLSYHKLYQKQRLKL